MDKPSGWVTAQKIDLNIFLNMCSVQYLSSTGLYLTQLLVEKKNSMGSVHPALGCI